MLMEAIPALIGQIGRSDFFGTVAESLCTALPAQYCAVFYYPRDAGPVPLNLENQPPEIRAGIRNYAEKTYLVNPFFRWLQEVDAPSGCHRMEDLLKDYVVHAIDDEFPATPVTSEEIGYLTHGWPVGLQEIMLVAALKDGSVIEFTAMRSRAKGGYRDFDLTPLRQFAPVLESLCRKQIEIAGKPGAAQQHGRSINDWLATFATDVLTEREREILAMVLQGYSSEAISMRLGIAVPTVKTHRQRAYAKLGISSQTELLRVFLDHIEDAGRHPAG